MSAVKNLRAMFENKDDTSPPDRGRTSGVSTPSQSGPHGTGSPRPLSKVRTSFVAVEKDGRMGLHRDPSHESSVSRRRMSNDTDAESLSLPDKSAAASPDELAKPARKLFVNEPIPESPRQPADTSDIFNSPPEETVNEAAKAPKNEPTTDKQPASSSETTIPSQPAPSPEVAVSSQSAEPAPNPAVLINKQTAKQDNEKSKAEPSKIATSKAAPTLPKSTTQKEDSTSKTRPNGEAAKPSKTAPASGRAISKPEPKPTTTTAAARRAPTKPDTKREVPAAPKPSASSAAKAPSAVPRKPQVIRTKPSHDAGFVKPKVKSPTKPVSLPPSLTAPTASSVSKGGPSRQSLSRQSGSIQSSATNARPLSRATGSTLAPAKTVRRQASSIGRPKPSFGPPPKRPGSSEPPSKKSSTQVDEGFLARMMRPTQASSSKVLEKTPATPPKKTGGRQSLPGAQTNAKPDKASKREGAKKSPPAKLAGTGAAEVSSGAPRTPTEPTNTAQQPSQDASLVETASSPQAVTALTEENKTEETPEEPENATRLVPVEVEASEPQGSSTGVGVVEDLDSTAPEKEPEHPEPIAVMDAPAAELTNVAAPPSEVAGADKDTQTPMVSDAVEEQIDMERLSLQAPEAEQVAVEPVADNAADVESEERAESLPNAAV